MKRHGYQVLAEEDSPTEAMVAASVLLGKLIGEDYPDGGGKVIKKVDLVVRVTISYEE